MCNIWIWVLVLFWFEGLLHHFHAASKFLITTRIMVLSPCHGPDICKTRSLWELWLRNGSCCLKHYPCVDLRMIHELWNYCQPGMPMSIIAMKEYMVIGHGFYTKSFIQVSLFNKYDKWHAISMNQLSTMNISTCVE